MERRTFVQAALASGTAVLSSAAVARDRSGRTDERGLKRLQQELGRIAASSPVVTGLAVHHIETGRRLALNGERPLRTGSTQKVPVAVHILALADEGKLQLQQRVTLEAQDFYRTAAGDAFDTWGPINTFLTPGSALSVRDIIAAMLIDSDNLATDILYRIGGGPAAVKARMRSFGLKNLNNDRLIRETSGPLRQQAAPWAEAGPDLRDTSTPNDLAMLLTLVWSGKILSPASRALLQDIMYRCITGRMRLRGRLPPQIRVAHKTGSTPADVTAAGGVVINDVGVIELPAGAGHLVIAALTQYSEPQWQSLVTPETVWSERMEALIADLARASYDYFTLHSA